MKKLLSLLLALSLMICAFALTLTSCETDDDETPKDNTVATLAGKTPEELYNTALEEISSLVNLTSTSSQEISMNAQGVDMKMTQTVIAKATSLMNQSVTVSNSTQMQYQGEWMDMGSSGYSVIVADGVLYTDQSGQKIKVAITEETLMDYMPEGSSTSGSMALLPTSFFEGTRFKPNSDGTYSVAVTMSAEKYTEYFGEFSSALGGEVEIKKVVHSINFTAEGELVDIVSDIDLSVTVDGVSVDATAVSTTVFTDLGTTETVTAPADADSYMVGHLQ